MHPDPPQPLSVRGLWAVAPGRRLFPIQRMGQLSLNMFTVFTLSLVSLSFTSSSLPGTAVGTCRVLSPGAGYTALKKDCSAVPTSVWLCLLTLLLATVASSGACGKFVIQTSRAGF